MHRRRSPRFHLSAAALVTVFALVAAACGASSKPHASGATRPTAASNRTGPGSSAATPVAKISWHSCSSSALSGLQCATLQVPLNPADPTGPTIGLALDRKAATGSKIGSLLVNPGGPGASGVDTLPGLYEELSPDLRQHFDVVGFDPPGVGHSDGVTCLDNSALAAYYNVDPAPPTPAGLGELTAANKQFADGCEARSGKVLPYVSTSIAAHDMDLIRAALGDPKLNYLGFSYGTYLGATYAEEYPTHVRAMVLDGATDPTLDTVTELDQQSAALDNGLDKFFSWCSSDPSCSWKPRGKPLRVFEGLLARVRATPLPAQGTTRTVGPAELLYGAGDALYSQQTWPDLGDALQEAQAGDGTGLLSLFDQYTERNPDGSYSDIAEAETAVNCLDDPTPPAAQLEADAPAASAAAPVFGVMNLFGDLSCDVWPVKASGRPHAITAPGSPPIVVVGSTGDPITPYSWARHLASMLSHGVLLTRIGYGHTAYGASLCIDNQLDKYLVNLHPPAAGTRCQTGTSPNPVG
ncbi:MAG: alpha/beta fold hydrolase [Acidimicrobiaceae bacterium]|nr:alpha/beta fold hydrolase [Acidimicrobiaceae bacterium]